MIDPTINTLFGYNVRAAGVAVAPLSVHCVTFLEKLRTDAVHLVRARSYSPSSAPGHRQQTWGGGALEEAVG